MRIVTMIGLVVVLVAAPAWASDEGEGIGSRLLDAVRDGAPSPETRGPENPTVPGGGEPGMDAERLRGERGGEADSIPPTGATFPPRDDVRPGGDHPPAAAPRVVAPMQGNEGSPTRTDGADVGR